MDKSGKVVGINPHFAGSAVVRVGVQRGLQRPNSSCLDGAFYGWANADGENPENGDYPFVFDAPDYDLYQAMTLPRILETQIAGFAHEIDCYANEADYYAAQDNEIKFASESFIPSGLFTPQGADTVPPEA